jgi:hypothetical protein
MHEKKTLLVATLILPIMGAAGEVDLPQPGPLIDLSPKLRPPHVAPR